MKTDNGVEAKLDWALEMTFPASDPFVIDVPQANGKDGRAALARERRFENRDERMAAAAERTLAAVA